MPRLYAGGTNGYVWQYPWGTTNHYSLIDASKAASITNGITYGQVVANLGPGCVGVTENVSIPRWYFSDRRVLHVWPTHYLAGDVLHSSQPVVEGYVAAMTGGTFYFETNAHPPAPDGGEQVVLQYVGRLLLPKPQLDNLRGVRLEDLQIVEPLPGYTVEVTNLADEKWLSSARFDSWIYVLLDGTNTVGAVRLRDERKRSGKWKTEVVSGGGDYFSRETLEAQRIAEQLPQTGDRDYEVRRLDIWPLWFDALWLHGKSEDIIIPFPSKRGKWNAYQPYSESQIIELLKPEARKFRLSMSHQSGFR